MVIVRASTSICPRLSAAIFVCAENVIKNGSFLHHCSLHVVYRHAQHKDLCERLHHIIIIIIILIIIITIIIIVKPLLKFFNECRSVTGVGELNPY